MSTFKSSMLLAVGSLFLTQFINHSPYSVQTYPPVHDWADQPMKLVATPYYETKKEDIWTAGATHMALVHNAMIRGFNSIYQQAPWLIEDNKAAFVGYGLTWAKFVLSHHDDEEHTLFKKVSVVLDDEEIWEATHKEHEAVTDGIAIFQGYLKGLADPRNLTSQTLIKIMDDMLPAFEEHMHSEVKVIAALDKHPRAPVEGSMDAIRAKNVFAEWGKKTITKAGLLDVLPFFLLNLDKTYEEGMWADWPPMPKPIRWTFINIVGMLRGKQMKFASCDSDGMPKELWVYDPKDAKAAKDKKKGKK